MLKKFQKLKTRKGFTLVELIVVIAIIAVLAAILIPVLSGVIENSRKRSAESTCHSIQSMAKAFASTVLSKKGEACTASSKVDMDEDGITETTMKEYIERQIPEITSAGSTRGAKITLKDGMVKEILYTEGAFTAKWDNTNGYADTERGAANAAAAGAVTVV